MIFMFSLENPSQRRSGGQKPIEFLWCNWCFCIAELSSYVFMQNHEYYEFSMKSYGKPMENQRNPMKSHVQPMENQ